MIPLRKNNKKGFTLAELLIVVAIIAVLVAIAIPVFTTQLEKSREATDVANVRSSYAVVVAEGLVADPTTTDEVTATVELKQQQNGWQGADPTDTLAQLDAEFSGATDPVDVTVSGTPRQGGNCLITFTLPQGDTAGRVTINFDGN